MSRLTVTLTAIAVISAAIYGVQCHAGELIKTGNQYKIIKPVYLYAQYNNLNEREISKEKATAYLHSKEYANKSTVAFQNQVPIGTIMTIVGSAPKVWHISFFANRYFVALEPDLSRGLEIIIELSRGIEGNLDGLNPELFQKE